MQRLLEFVRLAWRAIGRVRSSFSFLSPFVLPRYVSGWWVASCYPLPAVPLSSLFPHIDAQLVQVATVLEGGNGGNNVGDSTIERIVLVAGMAKAVRAKRLLEIGTCSGFMARHLALNCGPDSVVWTLDLPPDSRVRLERAEQAVAARSAGAGWYVGLWPERSQIRQVRADSAKYDYGDVPYGLDFAFIDGAHNYPYVVVDSVNVLLRTRPGGVVVWDDWLHFFPGVIRAVGEVSKVVSVCRLRDGSTLAVAVMPDDWPRSEQRLALEALRDTVQRSISAGRSFF